MVGGTMSTSGAGFGNDNILDAKDEENKPTWK